MSTAYKPSNPDLFVVVFGKGDFSAWLKANKAFEPGDVIAPITGKPGVEKDYTTVQFGPKDHFKLDSDLVYANHSCDPNTIWDMSSPNLADWVVRASKRIEPGEGITFFYPSTEWDMDQPFECQCKAPNCLGTIRGAKYLPVKELQSRGFVSPWIARLIQERDSRE
ncbi:hypothetical protein K474DRAFT_1661317 [Panus rudis PR-1116 ss-1]|nr:hypothetical protein K474DRAFT_1661317 [Panus rudis PR-1116 ss-1]